MKKTAALLLTVFVAFSALAFTLTGCGGGESGDAGDPAVVAQEFVDATMAEDADAAYELLSAASKSQLESRESLVEGTAEFIEEMNVGEATIEDDEAFVESTIKPKGFDQELSFNIVLVDENGEWKISLAETGAGMDKAIEQVSEETMEQ